MKQIGLIQGLIEVYGFKRKTQLQKDEIQKQKLYGLVKYAKENSPYFRQLYSGIEENFSLGELPPTSKTEMMLHFDEWLTDRNVHIDEIHEFTKDLDNIGRKFKDKYLVFTTSGSTGNPSIVLYDKTSLNVMSAIGVMRAYARKEDMKAFLKKGKKSAGIYATGGFYLGNSTIRNNLIKMPWKKKQMMVTSVLNPLSKIVEELNAFQPAMLGGYPTALELLIDEQCKGRLKFPLP